MEKADFIKSSSCMNVYESTHPMLKIGASLNPYVGCIYNCVYCPFAGLNRIGVKTDYLHLLEKRLLEKDKSLHIGLGTITEPYNINEKEFNLTHHTIEMVIKHNFPLQIFTKSDLILRDIDMLKGYSKEGMLAVSVSFSTMDAKLSQFLEPDTASVEERLKLLGELKKNEIFSGIVLAPIIPFVTDSTKQLETVFDKASKIKADYLLPSVMMFINDAHRQKTMDVLRKKFPKNIDKIENIYKGDKFPEEMYVKSLDNVLSEFGNKYKVPLYLPTENEAPSEVNVKQEILS